MRVIANKTTTYKNPRNVSNGHRMLVNFHYFCIGQLVLHFESGTIFTGADSILMVCAGAVSDALAIRNSISFLDMLALPGSLSPFFFLPPV